MKNAPVASSIVAGASCAHAVWKSHLKTIQLFFSLRMIDSLRFYLLGNAACSLIVHVGSDKGRL